MRWALPARVAGGLALAGCEQSDRRGQDVGRDFIHAYAAGDAQDRVRDG